VDNGHNNIRRIVVSPFSITTPIQSSNCVNSALLKPGDISEGSVAFDSQGRIVFEGIVVNGGSCTFQPQSVELIMRGDQVPTGTVTSFTPLAGSTVAGNTGDGIPANTARLSQVRGIVINPSNDDVYFIDSVNNHRLRRIPGGNGANAINTILGTFNTTGYSAFTAPGAGLMTSPGYMVRDPSNGDMYFTEDGSNALRLVVP
jgi:hypothetical protein